jgi:ABC-type multidrug transport system fused ATPase/permease subunit
MDWRIETPRGREGGMTGWLMRPLVRYPFMGPALAAGTLAVATAARSGAHAGPAGVVAALLVFYVSAALMHVTARLFDHTRLSIVSFFYVSYIPMIYLPAFVVFGGLTDPARWTFLIGVQGVLLMVPLGVGAMNLIARYSRGEDNRFYAGPMVVPGNTTVEYHVAMTIFIVSALVTVAYFSQLQFERIPLVYMFAHPNDVDRLQGLREESFKLFDPRWNTTSSSLLFYGFLFLRTLLFPFLILFALGYFLSTRERRWFVLFVVSLLLGGFYAAASIARAPLAAIVMRIMFFYYVFRHGAMGRRMTTGLVAAMLAFPVFVTAFAYGSAGMADAFLRVGKRFFYTPADDLYVYFEIFPRHVDYQYGGTLIKPILKLFELPYFYIENYVYLYQFPNGVETGHANAAFLSNLHADFGLVGVFAGSLLIGMLMQAVQIQIARQRKTVLSVATFAFMMYAFWVLNFGSITSVLGTNGVVAVLLMAWGVRILTRTFRRAAVTGREARLANGAVP